eukprot:3732999-Prymnesium_polylepis.1
MRDGGSMARREVPIGELLAAAGHRAGARQSTIGHVGGGERGIGMDTLATPPLSNIDELAQMMAESTIDDVLRHSVHELGNSGTIALSGITAPDAPSIIQICRRTCEICRPELWHFVRIRNATIGGGMVRLARALQHEPRIS